MCACRPLPVKAHCRDPLTALVVCHTAELQRYYAAAAEAAQDVLVETGNDKTAPESNLELKAVEGAHQLDSPRWAHILTHLSIPARSY